MGDKEIRQIEISNDLSKITPTFFRLLLYNSEKKLYPHGNHTHFLRAPIVVLLRREGHFRPLFLEETKFRARGRFGFGVAQGGPRVGAWRTQKKTYLCVLFLFYSQCSSLSHCILPCTLCLDTMRAGGTNGIQHELNIR